jgi:hypothetical protein
LITRVRGQQAGFGFGGQHEHHARRRLFQHLQQRVGGRRLHTLDAADEAHEVLAGAGVVQPLLDGADLIDADGVGAGLRRLGAVVLRDVRMLADGVPILVDLLDPQLVQTQEIRMDHALDLVAHAGLGLRRNAVAEEVQREPARGAEFAHVLGAGKQVRVRDVVLGDVL